MSIEATVAVIEDVNSDFKLKKVKYNEPLPDEVLVRVVACGICHTDFVAQNITPLPAIFGHEGSGIIERVGSNVKGFLPGDKVLVAYPSCGDCGGCDTGKPYHCDHHMELGFKGSRLDGSKTLCEEHHHISDSFFQQSSFGTFCIANARNIVKVPDDADLKLLASIPCGVQTGAGSVINTFDMNANNSIAVFGAGAVGLSAIMAAKIVGAKPIVAVDIVEERLELAKELGATHTVLATQEDVAGEIMKMTGGVDFSLETSGNEKALEASINCLATAGTCGMVISPNFGQKYPFSPTDVFKGAKNLCGIVQGSSLSRDFLPRVIQWHKDGLMPIEKMVKYYSFEDINTAAHDTKKGTTIKSVLVMEENYDA